MADATKEEKALAWELAGRWLAQWPAYPAWDAQVPNPAVRRHMLVVIGSLRRQAERIRRRKTHVRPATLTLPAPEPERGCGTCGNTECNYACGYTGECGGYVPRNGRKDGE